MTQPTGLFRAEALGKVASPEQLDTLARVTRPRGWLALAAVGVLLVGVVAWAFLGSIQTTVSGGGVLLTRSGTLVTATPEVGAVVSVLVASGDQVRANQPIATLRTSAEQPLTVRATTAGRVVENLAYPGDFVGVGAPLITLQPDEEELYAFLFVPAVTGKRLEPGTPVRIAPSTVQVEQYGLLLGRVDTVSSFPATAAGITALLNNPGLAAGLLAQGPVLQVRVALERSAETASGFAWTSGTGPPSPVTAGTLASGTVVVDEQRPLALLFPSTR